MHIQPLFLKEYFTLQYKIIKDLVAIVAYLKRLYLVMQVLALPKKYDLILLEYELFPYTPALFEYFLKKRDITYIVDYDDAAFHKYDMNYNTFARPFLKFFLKNKIAKVMKYADCVIVCNDYLESYAKKYNSNIVKIPTVVQLDKYMDVMRQYKAKEDKGFVIGWIGSLTTSVYVLDIVSSMKKFVDSYDNVRFHLVGFDKQLLSDKEREEAHIDVIGWKEEREIQDILEFDIGMMPLPDDAWSKGKCGFKLIQYMSCKKPVIASAIGMNCTLVENGINGLLVEDVDAWFEAFETLYLDADLRQTMAIANFNKITSDYNDTINCERYIKLVKNMIMHKRGHGC